MTLEKFYTGQAEPEDSGLPCAILTYTAENRTSEPVKISVTASLANPIGEIEFNPFGELAADGLGGNINEYREGNGFRGIYFRSEKYASGEITKKLFYKKARDWKYGSEMIKLRGNSMPTIQTELFGVKFPNPFVLAAGPPTASGDRVIKAFRAGWGGAVLKTMGLVPTRHPHPRIHIIKAGREKRGILDIELFSDQPLEWWESEIETIRREFPIRPLVASIAGGTDATSWQEVVRRLEPHEVSAFEMNVSCPSFDKEKGVTLGQDPLSLGKAVEWVRQATRLPLFVKLTPNVTDIVTLARTARQAGADGFTMGNSLTGIGGVNLDTFAPLPNVAGRSIIGGYGGPGIKPVLLRCTASLAKAMPLPVMGCGGVMKWQDAAEYLSLGASLVQVCTAVMWNGYGIIDNLTRGLLAYLEDKGFEDPSALVGRALPNLGVFSDLDLSVRMVAALASGECNGCGICINACEAGGYQAIRLDGKLAVFDVRRCDGCGLCVGMCPLGVIEMVEV
jgi:dihydropyrimidine dehydrogenase (NAD+) subunit PreA